MPLCLQAVNRRNQRVLTLFYLFSPVQSRRNSLMPVSQLGNTTNERAPTFGKILCYLKSRKIPFPRSPTAVPINSRYKNGKQAGRSCDDQRKASLSRGGHLSLWFPSQWFGKREGKAQNLWKSCLVSQDFGATAPRLTTAHDKVSKNKRINEVTMTTKIIQSNCH